MLSVSNMHFMLSVIMMNIVMLSVVMLSVMAPAILIFAATSFSEERLWEEFNIYGAQGRIL
jgi:hypothetical protein